MLISQRSKEIIDNCRFCWMCRHICPIGNATGQERNTARARALGLSLVERGAEPLREAADNVYECALCGACTKECVTGWDPVQFTKEVRLEMAQNEETPAYINTLLDNLEAAGNVYGIKEVPAGLAKVIAALPKTADTLLFLGRDAIYKAPEAAEKAIELMQKLGVSFTVLADEPDSGYAMDFLVGAAAETKAMMEKTAKALDSFKTVVCYDPADAKVFLREYKEWDIPIKPQVQTFTAYLAAHLPKVKNSGRLYTPQDSALLARDLEETEPLREILSACGQVREMLLNRKDTMLAGNLIMNEYMPEVMTQVAKDRVVNAKNMDAACMVTAAPAEYVLLKSVSEIPVMSVEEVVLSCL